MDIETAGESVLRTGRAGILGWGETELVKLLEAVPEIKRVSHSWWKIRPSRMQHAVRNLGVALLVVVAATFLL